MQVVGNAKTFSMIPQFFDVDISERTVVVKEGDTLSLGKHTLQFFMAPMVHWPEVMVSYEQSEKILFSADGFVNLVLWMQTKHGLVKQDVIILILLENMVHRYKPFSKK